MANQHSQNKIKDMNLINKRFHYWLVIEDAGFVPHGEHIWECLCDCGTKRNVTAEQLVHGRSKSCGCYQKIRTRELFSLPLAEVGLNRVFGDYRKWASKKNNSFKLTREQVKELIESDCYYCGKEPSNNISVGSHKQRFIYQGIDRMDNDLGYTPENCVPSCIVCNKMKKAMSHDEFVSHIHTISSRFVTESPQPDFYIAEGVLCISE